MKQIDVCVNMGIRIYNVDNIGNIHMIEDMTDLLLESSE